VDTIENNEIGSEDPVFTIFWSIAQHNHKTRSQNLSPRFSFLTTLTLGITDLPAYSDTVYSDTVYSDTVYSDTVSSDTPLTVTLLACPK